MTTQITVLVTHVCRLSSSASVEDCEVISAKKLPQSTRETMATSGSSTKAEPAMAGAYIQPGTPTSRRTFATSGLTESCVGKHLLGLVVQGIVDKLLCQLGVLAVGDGGNRVAVDRRVRLGELDTLHVAVRPSDVGDVDEPGVCLTSGDLGEHVGHVLLLTDRFQRDVG